MRATAPRRADDASPQVTRPGPPRGQERALSTPTRRSHARPRGASRFPAPPRPARAAQTVPPSCDFSCILTSTRRDARAPVFYAGGQAGTAGGTRAGPHEYLSLPPPVHGAAPGFPAAARALHPVSAPSKTGVAWRVAGRAPRRRAPRHQTGSRRTRAAPRAAGSRPPTHQLRGSRGQDGVGDHNVAGGGGALLARGGPEECHVLAGAAPLTLFCFFYLRSYCCLFVPRTTG